MKKLDFSELESFEVHKKELLNVRGGQAETIKTGLGTTANGKTVQEYCTAADDGSWLQWYDF